MSVKLIHMQTTIQTVFGVLDDDGNAIPQQPVQATTSVFSAEAFTEVHRQIAEARDQAVANAELEQLEAAAEPGPQAAR